MKPKPTLHEHELTNEELNFIRLQIETLDGVDVSDEMRRLIEQQWPELLSKVTPRNDN